MDDRQVIQTFEDEFRKTKAMTEKAMAQVSDVALHAQINPHQNSIAVIVQHVAGNLLSRFTEFLSTDGEKPWRDRETEFTDRNLARPQLAELWERGWNCLFAALAPLRDGDLSKTVLIRNEPHSVLRALVRATAHCAWHASQVALISKHFVGSEWHYLTIPPKSSAEFNRKMGEPPFEPR
jgi:hypothetical protein